MWLGNEFSVSEAITTQIKVAKEINPVEISDFVSMWHASLKWTRSFPITRVMHGKIINEDINWSKTLPTGIRLFFQLEGKNLKNTTRSSQSGSSHDRSITLFTKQILPSVSIMRKVTKKNYQSSEDSRLLVRISTKLSAAQCFFLLSFFVITDNYDAKWAIIALWITGVYNFFHELIAQYNICASGALTFWNTLVSRKIMKLEFDAIVFGESFLFFFPFLSCQFLKVVFFLANIDDVHKNEWKAYVLET